MYKYMSFTYNCTALFVFIRTLTLSQQPQGPHCSDISSTLDVRHTVRDERIAPNNLPILLTV